MIPITEDFIKTYIEGAEKKESYKCRVEECEKVKLHSIDRPSVDMLVKYQPSEPDWAIEYKTKNWRAITKAPFEKIESVIAKVFRASDFVVKFPDSPNGARNGETLQDYTETKFPKVKSFLFWFQNIWLRQYLVEPNGVSIVQPLNMDKAVTDYWRPYPMQVEAEDVLYFDDDFLLVEKEDDKWLLVDKQDFVTITRTKDGNKAKFNAQVDFTHNLGYVPASFNGGKIMLDDENNFYYESVVSGVTPYWTQALMEVADKNVSIKQHVHPEKAVYGEDKCKVCDGTGRKTHLVGLERRAETRECVECGGSGIATAVTSPFGIHIIRPPRGSELPPPDWAPAKYIQKDISPLEFLDKDVDKLIKQGYAAVCMEQLAEDNAQVQESGIKKSYDMEQTNLFLYNIAVFITQFKLPWFYKVFSDYRYGAIGQGMPSEAILKMQPQINTPRRFDIVGVNDLKAQIADLKKAGVSPDIINELEKQLVGKEFSGDQDTISYLTAVIDLDPLRNFNVEDKSLMYASGSIRLEDFAVSSNIQTLVQKAAEMTPNFYDLTTEEKRSRIYELAKSDRIGQKAVTIPINATAQQPAINTGQAS